MLEVLKEFFTSTTLAELLLIMVLKAIEVSMGTLRHILVNKGYRKQGASIAFFEIILWVFIASRVITGFGEAPIKGIFYSGGYAMGVFMGSMIENKLAFGKILIQTITGEDKAVLIANALRSQGYGVTTVPAMGKDDKRVLLMIFANRKGKELIINNIYQIDHEAMIVTNEVSTLQGGYVSTMNKIAK